MSDEAPPLKVWIYPILAVIALIISFFSYTYSGFGPYARVADRANSELEAALAETVKDTSAISVVILGSSLTEQALADPKEVEDSIALMTGKKAKVLRVALNFMNMDIACRINFFPKIAKYPPRYLFIENFGLNMDNGDSSLIPIPVDAALLDLRNNIRSLMGLSTHDNYYSKWYTFDMKPLENGFYYTDKFDSATYKSLLEKRSVVRDPAKNAQANEAYAALMNAKTTVVFLDMPQSGNLPKNFLDDASRPAFDEMLKYYKSRYNVEYWQYPHKMEDRFIYDGAHLNAGGGRQYQRWFVSEIASRN